MPTCKKNKLNLPQNTKYGLYKLSTISLQQVSA